MWLVVECGWLWSRQQQADHVPRLVEECEECLRRCFSRCSAPPSARHWSSQGDQENISYQQLQNIISAGNIQGSSSFMEIFAKLFQSFNKNILFSGVPAVRTFLSPRLTLVPDFWWLQECDVTEITDSRAKMVQVYVETPWYCDDTEWVEKYVNECSLVSVTN